MADTIVERERRFRAMHDSVYESRSDLFLMRSTIASGAPSRITQLSAYHRVSSSPASA